MDTSQYTQMFLAECREHLQELNLAVVRIEEQPEDGATVDEIFRIAHSLKGMSATMGFAGMAALTHQMEDVFELLRQRSGGLGRDTVDVLLECLDALEGGAWRATRALRTLVRFEQGDLLRMPVPRGRYDLIMCRNTVIYFTEDVRDALHARLADALRPGGVLVVGATERVTAPEAIGLRATAPFTYAKAA